MSGSQGTGSPIAFLCYRDRKSRHHYPDAHRVQRTGRERPYHAKYGSMLGLRSMTRSVEYRCSCGHVGWSNHADIMRYPEVAA